MIKIAKVQGRCLLMNGLTSTTPTPGTELRTAGFDRVYILMTGPRGEMTLATGSKTFRLKANSIARIRGSLAPEFANRPGTWDEAKLLIGRIWARLKGHETLDEIIANVAVGVRG